MLNSFVRSCSLLAAAVVSVAILPRRRSHASHPASPLDALEAANAKGDARAIMGLITPEGQKRLARETVMNGLMPAGVHGPRRSQPDGTEADRGRPGEEARGVQGRQDRASPRRSSRRPRRRHRQAAHAGAKRSSTPKIGAADPTTLVPALFDAAVKAGPGLGMKEKPRLDEGRPFTGLKVDGDHATVKSGPRTHEDRQDRRQVAGRRAPARDRTGPVARNGTAGPAARQDRPPSFRP